MTPSAKPEAKHIVSVGECMVEIAQAAEPDRMQLGFGGDTLNTAIYLARLLGDRARVSYMTRLGDDAYSKHMMEAWRSEGIDTGQVEVVPGRVAGLYAIRLDDSGERSFTYWRKEAPARELFTQGDVADRIQTLSDADAVFFSGITLSIFPDEGRTSFLESLDSARRNGAMIVFDPNHRPVCWAAASEARQWYERAYRASTVAIAGLAEESEVFGDRSLEQTLSRLGAYGCSEVVVRDGVRSTAIRTQGETALVQPERAPIVRDTTAAGDSFNAGYMAGRIAGMTAKAAVELGHDIAAKVIQHPGAIIPSSQIEPLSHSGPPK